jgi:hypothetical protein
MYDINKKNLSDEQLIKKVKIHRNSNTFLIFLWLLTILIFKDGSFYFPNECTENFGFGPSGHGCVTEASVIAAFFMLILFLFSITEGILGIILSKNANNKTLSKDIKILKITSYVLLIPLFLLIIAYGIDNIFH